MGYPQFDPTTERTLPAGVDVALVVAEGDDHGLYAVWNTFHHTHFLRETLTRLDHGELDRGYGFDSATARDTLRENLARHAQVTEIQALEANRRLTEGLTGQRGFVVDCARQAGHTWKAIGAALGISGQDALDWYTRNIDHTTEPLGRRTDPVHAADRAWPRKLGAGGRPRRIVPVTRRVDAAISTSQGEGR
ncbi:MULTISPECIES: hypothetical protein [Nocardia]|uniref:hypothetical protein n=1 Tax=Nocardia TaxID=1817 RepID=UPI000D68C43C|nr:MULTISPECIES: hypothetical protein [Nocardia]